MLYLGIDQHARQITISLRDDSGDVLQARQVSTRPDKIHDFFDKLTRESARLSQPFIAVLEVCGFNDWLIRLLQDYRCHKVILIQPEERKQRKTDRRDAAALSEILWVNRERFLAGKPVRGLRLVRIVSTRHQKEDRLVAEIVWTLEAARWLEDIHEFIATDRLLAAHNVVAGIYEKVQLLRNQPRLGQLEKSVILTIGRRIEI